MTTTPIVQTAIADRYGVSLATVTTWLTRNGPDSALPFPACDSPPGVVPYWWPTRWPEIDKWRRAFIARHPNNHKFPPEGYLTPSGVGVWIGRPGHWVNKVLSGAIHMPRPFPKPILNMKRRTTTVPLWTPECRPEIEAWATECIPPRRRRTRPMPSDNDHTAPHAELTAARIELGAVRTALVTALGGEDAIPEGVTLADMVDALAQLNRRYFQGWSLAQLKLKQAKRTLHEHGIDTSAELDRKPPEGKPAREELLGVTWSAEPLTPDEITRARIVGIDVGDATDQCYSVKWALIRQDTARREAERAPKESSLTMEDIRHRYDC
jgi:hypothetical protein